MKVSHPEVRNPPKSVSIPKVRPPKMFAVISAILGRGECLGCGRVALLAVEFAVDPGPELRENGVTSVTLTGM